MKQLLRKLRGIVGTGLTWAVGFGVAYVGLFAGFGFPYGNLFEAGVNGVILGFCAGGSFATILSIAERRRTLDQLSVRRVAAWGAIGGMALLLLFTPLVFGSGRPIGDVLTSYLVQLSFMGILGAGFSTGSVALARRGDLDLLEGEDTERLSLDGG